MDISLSKLRETVKDREPWHFAVHGVTESDSTEWINNNKSGSLKYFNKANGSFCVLLSPKNFLYSLYLVTKP